MTPEQVQRALAELPALGFDAEKEPDAARHALAAMEAAKARLWDQAGAALARAAGLTRSAWPHALRALVCGMADDHAGAKEALLAALKAKPSAWLALELARVYERLGILPEAIENAAAAIKLQPSAEARAFKAHLHVCWREYREAIAEYTAALESEKSAALYFERSRARSAMGDLKGALADAEAALKLEPGSEALAGWRFQLRLFNGKGGRGAPSSFFEGYAALCAGDFAAAEAAFGRGAGPKNSFYRTVARVMRQPEAGALPEAELYLLGLGVNPPYSATAEALRLLPRCDVLFNNIMDEENFEILRPFCRDCRPVAYHQMNDEDRLCREILAEVEKGRTVAFVTRGSAIVQGPLATELSKRCSRMGRRWACVSSVSSSDLIGARHDRGPAGCTALDSSAVAAGTRLDPSGSTLIYLDMKMPPSAYAALCSALEASFGPGRECLIFDHVVGQRPRRAAARELASARPSLSPSAIFYFPGKP